MNVGVIDYGAGNIASVMKAIDYAGADPVLVSTTEQIAESDKLVLPGVGAAGRAIDQLREKNLDQALEEAVLKQGKPFIGICVGMQLLADDMYEFGHHKGLGWIKGEVVSLQDRGIKNHPVPHMGWGDVEFRDNQKDLASRIGPRKEFYFCHSYTLVTDEQEKISATVEYERELVAAVSFDNVSAFQFHPEKSQVSGDVLMQWFLDWEP